MLKYTLVNYRKSGDKLLNELLIMGLKKPGGRKLTLIGGANE